MKCINATRFTGNRTGAQRKNLPYPSALKPKPTEKDPAAYEVVAAGLFDENWQFPNKK